METARIRLLGAEMDVLTVARLMGRIADGVARARAGGEGLLVGNHNLHSIKLLRDRDPAMTAFYAEADLVQIDSMPLIAWGRLLGRPVGRDNRLTYLDWREAFWKAATEGGWRVFHLGCAPGVNEKAIAAIRSRWPGARIEGRDGFFDMDGAENEAVLEAIARARADVLLVGMGMPRQEAWMIANRHRLPPMVMVQLGGAFAYEAEVVPTPPRWTGRLGVEWLWRFSTEPRRLFHRYFIEPWGLAGPAFEDARALVRRAPAGR